jgi:hypothetical protein
VKERKKERKKEKEKERKLITIRVDETIFEAS